MYPFMTFCCNLNGLLLLTLVTIENSNVLLTRFIRSSAEADQLFKISDMMLVTELCKVLLATLLELWHSQGRLTASLCWNNLLSYQSLLVALPAVLYFVQNSLFYVALTNLPAPIFQVLYQMKLLTTALVSVLLLTRRYSSLQWLSLCSLTFGTVLAVTFHNTSSDDGAKPNALIGIFAVIIACFCSAFAGVGFEKLLKQDSTSGSPSLWMRNIQLGTFSVLFATLQLIHSNYFNNQQKDSNPKPFLFGFSILVWMLVFLRASCGILVAIIIKHMDNVVKSITSCVSVLAGCLISMFLLGDVLDWKFWLGAGIVAISSYSFSQPPPADEKPWQVALSRVYRRFFIRSLGMLLSFSVFFPLILLHRTIHNVDVKLSTQLISSSPKYSDVPSHPFVFLVDCDDGTIDMVLNSLLCWAKVRGVDNAAKEYNVLCLSSRCCDMVSSFGLRHFGKDDMFQMYIRNREGYQKYAQTSHLDSVMITRELVVQHLLFQGYSVLRADADVCVTADLVALADDLSLDMLVSAQDPGHSLHQTTWAHNYHCNGTQFLSLNNGLAFVKGQPQVATFYALAVGRSLRIMVNDPSSADGFAQKGFNQEAKESKFCVNFGLGTWNGSMLSGKTSYNALANFNISIFSVCSPCDRKLYCGSSYAVHANCLQGFQKRNFLDSQNAWHLHANWLEILAEMKGKGIEESIISLEKSSFWDI